MTTFFKYWFTDSRLAFPLWFWIVTILISIIMIMFGLWILGMLITFMYLIFKGMGMAVSVASFEINIENITDIDELKNLQITLDNDLIRKSNGRIHRDILNSQSDIDIVIRGMKISNKEKIDLSAESIKYSEKTKLITDRIRKIEQEQITKMI